MITTLAGLLELIHFKLADIIYVSGFYVSYRFTLLAVFCDSRKLFRTYELTKYCFATESFVSWRETFHLEFPDKCAKPNTINHLFEQFEVTGSLYGRNHNRCRTLRILIRVCT